MKKPLSNNREFNEEDNVNACSCSVCSCSRSECVQRADDGAGDERLADGESGGAGMQGLRKERLSVQGIFGPLSIDEWLSMLALWNANWPFLL